VHGTDLVVHRGAPLEGVDHLPRSHAMTKHTLPWLLTCLLFAPGCGDGENVHAKEMQRAMEDAGKDVERAANEMMKMTYDKREELSREMNSKLDEAEKSLAAYRKKIEDLAGEAEDQARATADRLEKELESARQRADELGKSSEDAWSKTKDATVDAWRSLKRGLDDAASEFE
jgi:hypothetical protein